VRSRRVCALVLALVVMAVLAACHDDGHQGHHHQPRPKPSVAKTTITLGVVGGEDEISAYRSVVDVYNTLDEDAQVKISTFPDEASLTQAVEGTDPPDVFIADRTDLGDLLTSKAIQPLGDLLDDRNVDFGDDYSRTALEAFSANRDLQCMPWGISPMVIYYNRALVDFDAMAAKGLDVPGPSRTSWNFDQFTAAAQYAARPRKGVAGVYIEPTLRGLGPFVYSGGGDLYDDDQTPTSLAFSSSGTKSALDRALPVLADPRSTLSSAQLAQKTPLQWFEDGKLGMIAGFRSLVPELRLHSALDWDVIAMPGLDQSATVGDLTGACISSHTRHVGDAADFLVNLISADSERQIVSAGYLAPANTTVAFSSDFLQPGRAPDHAVVFNNALKPLRLEPVVPHYGNLQSAVSTLLAELFAQPTPDLDILTQEIDDASQPLLAPPPTPSATPSDSASATESSSPSG
jgi:multiple sugar transport system substrate-binding protein